MKWEIRVSQLRSLPFTATITLASSVTIHYSNKEAHVHIRGARGKAVSHPQR
jgi:hypothetical protein